MSEVRNPSPLRHHHYTSQAAGNSFRAIRWGHTATLACAPKKLRPFYIDIIVDLARHAADGVTSYSRKIVLL